MSQEIAKERGNDRPRRDAKECSHLTTSKVYPGWTWCPDCWLLQGPPNENAKYLIVMHPGIFKDIEEMPETARSEFYEVAQRIAVDPRVDAVSIEEME